MAGSLLHAQDGRLVDESFLASVRNEAIRNHPAARSAALRANAAGKDIQALRLWDDPSVGLSLMAAAASKRRDDGDVRLSFEQPLPKPGLFAANRTKAEALQRAGVENSRTSALETGAIAAKDAIELALADESLLVQADLIRCLDGMVENARQKAINPGSTSADALRLESELARENQILDAARRSRESLACSLNLRLGRSLESPWPALKLPTTALPVPVARAEIARISNVNPKVRSMRAMASAAAADTAIADRERHPQLALGVETNVYSGGDVRDLSVGLKMSLPYFNRSSYDAKIGASQLREKAAVADIETVRLEVAAAVLAAVADAENAAAQARANSGEIYDHAVQASEAVESAWVSSKATFADLLDSKQRLFAIRLQQRRFIAMERVALEELNLLVPRRP